MKIKKLTSIGAAFVVAFSSLFILVSPQSASAVAPYTCTWTGAVDNNFSTAGNWSGCNSAAPQAADGDNLVFPNTVSNLTPNNDLSGATFGSITFQGTAFGMTISGNSFTVTGGITDNSTGVEPAGTGGSAITNNITFTGNQSITVTASTQSLDLTGVVSGSANLTKAGAGALYLGGNNTFSGSMTINAGQVLAYSTTALGGTGAGTTVNDGGNLVFNLSNGSTVSEPLTFNSTSSPAITTKSCQGSCATGYAMTLSGSITLQKDLLFASTVTTTITGALSGSFAIQMLPGQQGSLIINSSNNTSGTPNGTVTSAAQTVTVAAGDNQPNLDMTVSANNILILDGVRKNITVNANGTLKGTGTAGNIYIIAAGILAPGNSPGCLTAGSGLTEYGTYQVELGGTTACSGYDQMRVTGIVTLSDTGGQGTLSTSIYGTFKPAKGNVFTIIDNDGSDAVKGNFSGLAEGTTFELAGNVFKISYVGGDGNDVTLTALSVGTPDTGFAIIKANPLISLAVTTVFSFGIIVIARRYRTVSGR